MSDQSDWQDDFDPPPVPVNAANRRSGVFAATLPTLPEVQRFVATQAAAAGLGADDTVRLALIVEELFINSVTHGGPPTGPAGQVRLSCWMPQPESIRVDYRDRGDRFNPLTDGPAVPEPAGQIIDYLSRRTGGVGLWLLRHYAREAEYDYLNGCNRFCFSVGSGAAPPQTKM